MKINLVKNFLISKLPVLNKLSEWAEELKKEILAIYLAARHPQTPLPAKALSLAVVVYAVSPIDLIPDFIPILGYLDDLVLVPLGIYLVLQMISPEIITECRQRAQVLKGNFRIASYVGLALILSLWGLIGYGLYIWLFK
ncbi:MAG: YkvA family protein [Pseudomonadota bacterium]